MDFTIDVTDCKSIATRYKAAGPIIADEMVKAMTRSQYMVVTTAKQLVPVDTGRLKGEIGLEPAERAGTTIIGRVGVKKVTYARAVEFGARAHRIVATKARALSFVWNGKRVFFTSVWHPGNRPYPYLIPGLQRNLGRINAEFAAVPLRALRRVKG